MPRSRDSKDEAVNRHPEPQCAVCSTPKPKPEKYGNRETEMMAWVAYNDEIHRHFFLDIYDPGEVREHDMARRLWLGEERTAAEDNVRATVEWWYTMRRLYPNGMADRVPLPPQQIGTHDAAGRWVAPWEMERRRLASSDAQ